jgi:hypothetical protein
MNLRACGDVNGKCFKELGRGKDKSSKICRLK